MFTRLLGTALLLATPAALPAAQFVDITPTLVLPSMSGRDVYAYYCVSCHGRNGRGDGPVAAALKTPPANLTRLAADNGGRFPADRVRAFVAHGRVDIPAHGSPEMPIWGPIFQLLDRSDTIAQTRLDNVVAYIQSIQAK